MKQVSKVNILAAQIRKAAPGTTRSHSMKQAWQIIKTTPTAQVLTFNKIKGEQTTRVVSTNWLDFYTPVGGKSNVKPGQILFVDLCKVAIGGRPIISTYTQNIVALA